MKASEVRAMCPKWVHGAGKPGGKFCEYLSPDEVWCRCDDIHCHVMPKVLRERQAKAEAAKLEQSQTSLLTATEKVTPAQQPAPVAATVENAPKRPVAPVAPVPPVAAPAARSGANPAESGASTATGLTPPADRDSVPGVPPGSVGNPAGSQPSDPSKPDPKVTEGVKRLIDETERITAYLSETTWGYNKINNGLACMRRYWLKYVVHVESETVNKNLGIGTFFHEAIDALDSHGETPDTSELAPKDRAKMIQAVMSYAGDPVHDQIGSSNLEVNGKMQFAGYPINLLIYIDRVSRDGKTLFSIEYGTEGIYETPLQTARHCALCLYLVPTAERVTFINVHRAKQKMKKGEPESDFGIRLKNESKEPWVNVTTYERKNVNVASEMNEIGMAALHIAMGVIAGYSTGVTHSNRDPIGCGNCEYNDLCEKWCECYGNPDICAGSLKAKCPVTDACNENHAHCTFVGLR